MGGFILLCNGNTELLKPDVVGVTGRGYVTEGISATLLVVVVAINVNISYN